MYSFCFWFLFWLHPSDQKEYFGNKYKQRCCLQWVITRNTTCGVFLSYLYSFLRPFTGFLVWLCIFLLTIWRLWQILQKVVSLFPLSDFVKYEAKFFHVWH